MYSNVKLSFPETQGTMLPTESHECEACYLALTEEHAQEA